MTRKTPEPAQVVKHRRDAALAALSGAIPYAQYLGVQFDRRGDEVTALLAFNEKLIGNPLLPALHGGVTAAFLEITALITISWTHLWEDIESGALDPRTLVEGPLPRLPKTIDFTVDYLRTGLPRDAYGRARVTRAGRRYASVQASAWQDHRDRPFAEANVHFKMPGPGA